MTLLEILYTVQNISQVFGKNTELSLEQFNNLINVAQDEVFKEFADGYLSGNGAEVDSRVSAAMSQFIAQRSWGLGVNVATRFGLTGKSFTVSSDVYKMLTAFVSFNIEDYPDKVYKVDIVTAQEAIERLSNAITYPTTEYPILYIDTLGSETTKYAYLIPAATEYTGLYAMSLNYPRRASLVLEESNGVYSQKSTSVNLKWDDGFHIDIIRKMLKYLGVMVGNEFVSQYIDQQKNSEK